MTPAPPVRVAVTGLGAFAATGRDRQGFWQACLAGRQAVAALPRYWREHARFRTQVWSPLGDIDFETLGFSRTERLQHDPVSLLAMQVAGEALRHAGLALSAADQRANSYRLDDLDPERVAVSFGTGVGGDHTLLANYATYLFANAPPRDAGAGGAEWLSRMRLAPRVSPFVIPMIMPNAPAASVAIKFGLRGPCHNHSVACSSGTVALGEGFELIRRGAADVVVAGGSEFISDACGGMLYGFDLARTLASDCDPPEQANRPFDQRRSGFVYSEGGAAALILERLDHARARGAPVLAEVLAFGETCDAYSLMSVAPDGAQIERLVRETVSRAGLETGDVGYVNAHGTGTQANDQVEAEMLMRVFGTGAAVNSSKSLLGHTIGASGALEALIAVESLRSGRLHPSLNLERPVVGLDFVTGEARRADVSVALSESFAFGGHNACLAFARA